MLGLLGFEAGGVGPAALIEGFCLPIGSACRQKGASEFFLGTT